MANLEDLALKRDRGYLLRLLLLLLVGVLAGAALFGGLTGEGVGSCMADTFLGQDDATETLSK